MVWGRLLTYMTLQPRFGQGLSEKIPALYSISSQVRPVTVPRALLSLIMPSAYLYFGLLWFRLTYGMAYTGRSVVGLRHLLSGAQHSANYCYLRHQWHLGCWTPYRVRNCTYFCEHHLLLLGHISCGEPSSQRRVIGSLFLLAPTFHWRTAGLGGLKSCRSLTLSVVPQMFF
jgi:hypothetical protein